MASTDRNGSRAQWAALPGSPEWAAADRYVQGVARQQRMRGSEAADFASDVLTEAAQQWRPEGGASFVTFAGDVARKRAIDRFRKQQSDTKVLAELGRNERSRILCEVETPGSAAERVEQELEAEAERLPPVLRAVRDFISMRTRTIEDLIDCEPMRLAGALREELEVFLCASMTHHGVDFRLHVPVGFDSDLATAIHDIMAGEPRRGRPTRDPYEPPAGADRELRAALRAMADKDDGYEELLRGRARDALRAALRLIGINGTMVNRALGGERRDQTDLRDHIERGLKAVFHEARARGPNKKT